MFKNPFSFNGRIRRSEYGISLIIYFASFLIVGNILDGNQKHDFIGFVIIPLFWFLLSQGAKRCHDRNHSGWYQIIPFYVLWMMFGEGTADSNEYGANPKERVFTPPVLVTPVVTATPAPEKKATAAAPVNNINSSGYSMDLKIDKKPVDDILDSLKTNKEQNLSLTDRETKLEIANVDNAQTQHVLKKLRSLSSINSLSYNYYVSTAVVTINHRNTSQDLLDELYKIMPGIEVRDVRAGHISIKIK